MYFVQGNITLIFSLLFSLAGLVLCLIAIYYLRLAGKSKSWPSTTGTIISSGIREVLKASDNYEIELKPEIRYVYNVGTDSYISRRIGIMPNPPTTSSARASKLMAKYPKDSQVSVYYNPDRPSQAVLEPGVRGDQIVILVIGIVILIISLLAAEHVGLKDLLVR